MKLKTEMMDDVAVVSLDDFVKRLLPAVVVNLGFASQLLLVFFHNIVTFVVIFKNSYWVVCVGNPYKNNPRSVLVVVTLVSVIKPTRVSSIADLMYRHFP